MALAGMRLARVKAVRWANILTVFWFSNAALRVLSFRGKRRCFEVVVKLKLKLKSEVVIP